jgi:hypothetical protein
VQQAARCSMRASDGLRHNGPVSIRWEVTLDWPRNLRKVMSLGVTAVALSVALAACSSSTPSAQSTKQSGSASIDISGDVVAHYTKHCSVGSDNTPNQLTVAFPDVTKVSGTPLFLTIYAPKSSASSTYPASSTATTVRLMTTKEPNYSWGGSSLGARGTMTVAGGGSAGTLDLMLAPTPLSSNSPTNQATGNIHLQGSWTGCGSA